MRRGQRQSAVDIEALERELAALKERQTQLRSEIRQRSNSGAGVRKLQEKLERQLATAKWTVQEIKALQPDWDDVGFYQNVQAVKPTPRGRRRAANNAGE